MLQEVQYPFEVATKQIHVNDTYMYICLGNRALHAKPNPHLVQGCTRVGACVSVGLGCLLFPQLFKKHSKTIFFSLLFPIFSKYKLFISLSLHIFLWKTSSKTRLASSYYNQFKNPFFPTLLEDPKLLFNSYLLYDM